MKMARLNPFTWQPSVAIAILVTFLQMTLYFGKGSTFSTPRGHGQMLGKHRDSEGHIDILDTLPSPKDFWDKYVSKKKPVLFHGAAKHSPGMHLWTDDYMLQNYGDLKVRIESKHQKNDYYPEGEKGIAQDTLRNVLKTYKTRDVYVVSQIPNPLTEKVLVLPFLTCGTFKDRILESNLWLGGRGTKSIIHKDADNAINCLYNGTKDWIMISQDYEHLIPSQENPGYSGSSLIDPDSVDLLKYPKFSEVPWWYANMKAGDCLFIPASHWHQVNSYGTKNMAVSVMFSRLKEVDLSDCDDDSLKFKPLSQMDMVFTYDGYGDQTMGDMDPFELQDQLVEMCQNVEDLTLAHVSHLMAPDNNEIETVMDDVAEQESLHIINEFFDVLDTNGDEILTCEEEILPNLSIKVLKKLANILSSDPTNTEKFEYAKISSNDIRVLLEHMISRLGSGQSHTRSKEEFIKLYQAIGGSQKTGSELYDIMDPSHQGFVTRQMVLGSMEEIIEMFDGNTMEDKNRSDLLQKKNPESLDNEVDSNHQWKKQKVHEEL